MSTQRTATDQPRKHKAPQEAPAGMAPLTPPPGVNQSPTQALEWCETGEITAKLWEVVPRADGECFLQLDPNEREQLLRQLLNPHTRDTSNKNQHVLQKLMEATSVPAARERFWGRLRDHLRSKHLFPDDAQLARALRRMKQCWWNLHKKQRRLALRKRGFTQNGTIAEASETTAAIQLQQTTPRTLPNPHLDYVPDVDIGHIRPETLAKLQRVEARLIAFLDGRTWDENLLLNELAAVATRTRRSTAATVLRIRGGVTTRAQQRKKHKQRQNFISNGYSLGRTIVGGGQFGKKSLGRSGSIHNTSVFKAKQPRQQVHCASRRQLDTRQDKLRQLQHQVIDAVSQVIEDAFGRKPWFTASLQALKNVPEDRLVPGRRIPVSHIWYTRDPKHAAVHTDSNSILAAFLFCARTFERGQLISLTPSGARSIHLKAGCVLGGRWAQFPHCNWHPTADRRSFVLYLDQRVLCNKYVAVDT
jgi:hypothetical protein